MAIVDLNLAEGCAAQRRHARRRRQTEHILRPQELLHAKLDLSASHVGLRQHLRRHSRGPSDSLLHAWPKLWPRLVDPTPHARQDLGGLNGAKRLEPTTATRRTHSSLPIPAAQLVEPRHLRPQGLNDAPFHKREGVAGHEQALGPRRLLAIIEQSVADPFQERRVARKPAGHVEARAKGNYTFECHPTPGGTHAEYSAIASALTPRPARVGPF